MPRAYASSVIDASADTVWDAIKDFNGLPSWHPAIAKSVIQDGGPANRIGTIRELTTGDGAKVIERLLGLSDLKQTCVYGIVEGPFPITGYIATLRVSPITDGSRCFIEWWSTFDCKPEDARGMIDLLAGAIYQGGFDALKKRFAR